MFVGDAPYVKHELKDLYDSRFCNQFLSALQEPGFGDPPRLPHAPYTSGNLVHQATHLRMFLETTNISVPEVHTIMEFGGGYGAMALLCDKMGFFGSYWIVDFPELSLLQEFYLSNAQGDFAHFIPVEGIEKRPVDLLIACYSLSEAPQEIRDLVLEKVRAQYYLFAFQAVYAGVDLKQEFKRITEEMSDVNWTWIQSPYFSRHTYLIGERNATS
jgi:hypothetical protein